MTGTFAHANNGHREKKFKRTWRTPREHPTARDKREPKAWIPCKAPNPSRQGEQGLSLFPTTWQEPRGEETKDADQSGKEIIEGRRPEILAQSWDSVPRNPSPKLPHRPWPLMWNPGDSGQAAVKANQWHDIIRDTNYNRKHTVRETSTQQKWIA